METVASIDIAAAGVVAANMIQDFLLSSAQQLPRPNRDPPCRVSLPSALSHPPNPVEAVYKRLTQLD